METLPTQWSFTIGDTTFRANGKTRQEAAGELLRQFAIFTEEFNKLINE